uniref:DUF803-domain-containing protein n=1 Tax=Guillardia theta TaxID=55529 RepID=A0A7S4P4L0_GUITH|mmetsp:Transcript_42976/g.135748  ORF Transcript_42976/g.135748 Transcript_42976/m.135748 type:complete len:721 (+) Transcript_42976:418-2580(+)
MTLDITCNHVCPKLLTNATCTAFHGCKWTPEGKCTLGQSVTSSIWIGIILSLVADIVINIGMNAMKYAHNTNMDDEGRPIKSFFLVPCWWIGMVGILAGEVGNLIAYGYAPASIVTPMGAVGVLTNVIITTYVLGEAFSIMIVFGVILVVGGIVLVVYFAPESTIVVHSSTFWEDVVWTQQFLIYSVLFIVLLSLFLYLGRNYGEKNVLVYIGTCAIIATLTIISSKTFSTLLSQAFETGNWNDWKYPAPYIAMVVMVVTAVTSMGYVNKAMMFFGNSIVVPTYYACFTVASVASVAFVYREFSCMTNPASTILFLLGIVMTVLGVCLLNVKDDGDEDEEPEKDLIKVADKTELSVIAEDDHSSTPSTSSPHGLLDSCAASPEEGTHRHRSPVPFLRKFFSGIPTPSSLVGSPHIPLGSSLAVPPLALNKRAISEPFHSTNSPLSRSTDNVLQAPGRRRKRDEGLMVMGLKGGIIYVPIQHKGHPAEPQHGLEGGDQRKDEEADRRNSTSSRFSMFLYHVERNRRPQSSLSRRSEGYSSAPPTIQCPNSARYSDSNFSAPDRLHGSSRSLESFGTDVHGSLKDFKTNQQLFPSPPKARLSSSFHEDGAHEGAVESRKSQEEAESQKQDKQNVQGVLSGTDPTEEANSWNVVPHGPFPEPIPSTSINSSGDVEMHIRNEISNLDDQLSTLDRHLDQIRDEPATSQAEGEEEEEEANGQSWA